MSTSDNSNKTKLMTESIVSVIEISASTKKTTQNIVQI